MSSRKLDRGGPATGCPVTGLGDGTWQVRGYEAARQLLRSTETVQAGLGVETTSKLPQRIRRPVLYRDGPEHREDRRQTARFFTPRRVDEHYRGMVVAVVERELAKLRATGRVELSDLSFAVAIDVVSAVLGLTESRPGIRRRLERFFPEKFGKPGLTSAHGLYWLVRQNVNWLRIYLADVRPAIRARRREPRDDLITHLLGQGCIAAEVLGECLTFAAAGMVTTREFVCVAAWHLTGDPALHARYRAAAEPERLAILHEILRLEPMIARLARRTTAPLVLGEVTVPAGSRVEVLVDEANADPAAVGDEPLTLCPERTVPNPAGLSFGDGPHRCPGAHIAMLETDVLLTRLFALDGFRLEGEPRVTYRDEIGGCEIRGLVAVADPVR
ncbi:cytochrome P450 [Amycolatopsis sacchari]|uniref:cytochrome P450 n=1 Tax=Amycolatopsis sacchari TaxID=115433 RepID=UPI003D7424F1